MPCTYPNCARYHGGCLAECVKDAPPPIGKRPVAWRVKDFADGWVVFQDEKKAYDEAQKTGALMQGLYVRDGHR